MRFSPFLELWSVLCDVERWEAKAISSFFSVRRQKTAESDTTRREMSERFTPETESISARIISLMASRWNRIDEHAEWKYLINRSVCSAFFSWNHVRGANDNREAETSERKCLCLASRLSSRAEWKMYKFIICWELVKLVELWTMSGRKVEPFNYTWGSFNGP